MSFFNSALSRLRLLGLLEGWSFVLLVGIAMPLKYWGGQPAAVKIMGTAHGVLFLLFLLAVVPVALAHRWGWQTWVGAVLASLLPGGPFVFESRVLKPLAASQAANVQGRAIKNVTPVNTRLTN